MDVVILVEEKTKWILHMASQWKGKRVDRNVAHLEVSIETN